MTGENSPTRAKRGHRRFVSSFGDQVTDGEQIFDLFLSNETSGAPDTKGTTMISEFLRKLTGSTSVPAIDHDELVQALGKKNCVVIDVREPHEFAGGHIPGAQNHPLSNFDPARIAQGKPVVLICQAGSRSARALRHALSAGRQDMSHYPGGMSGWRARGGSVT